MTFKEAFSAGIASMELGEWPDAEQHFAAALHASPSPGQTSESASYLAAIKLVKAQVSHICLNSILRLNQPT